MSILKICDHKHFNFDSFALKVEEVPSFETSVPIYRTTWCHVT